MASIAPVRKTEFTLLPLSSTIPPYTRELCKALREVYQTQYQSSLTKMGIIHSKTLRSFLSQAIIPNENLKHFSVADFYDQLETLLVSSFDGGAEKLEYLFLRTVFEMKNWSWREEGQDCSARERLVFEIRKALAGKKFRGCLSVRPDINLDLEESFPKYHKLRSEGQVPAFALFIEKGIIPEWRKKHTPPLFYKKVKMLGMALDLSEANLESCIEADIFEERKWTRSNTSKGDSLENLLFYLRSELARHPDFRGHIPAALFRIAKASPSSSSESKLENRSGASHAVLLIHRLIEEGKFDFSNLAFLKILNKQLEILCQKLGSLQVEKVRKFLQDCKSSVGRSPQSPATDIKIPIDVIELLNHPQGWPWEEELKVWKTLRALQTVLETEENPDLKKQIQRQVDRIENALIRRHYSLLLSLIGKFKRVLGEATALSQGLKGLYLSIRNFDLNRGLRFSTSAASRINGYLMQGFNELGGSQFLEKRKKIRRLLDEGGDLTLDQVAWLNLNQALRLDSVPPRGIEKSSYHNFVPEARDREKDILQSDLFKKCLPLIMALELNDFEKRLFARIYFEEDIPGPEIPDDFAAISKAQIKLTEKLKKMGRRNNPSLLRLLNLLRA